MVGIEGTVSSFVLHRVSIKSAYVNQFFLIDQAGKIAGAILCMYVAIKLAAHL